MFSLSIFTFFFFNDTATTEIYTLSLHDALPIYLLAAAGAPRTPVHQVRQRRAVAGGLLGAVPVHDHDAPVIRRQSQYRSEEHTSELQSQSNLVCRLLLEKKKHK